MNGFTVRECEPHCQVSRCAVVFKSCDHMHTISTEVFHGYGKSNLAPGGICVSRCTRLGSELHTGAGRGLWAACYYSSRPIVRASSRCGLRQRHTRMAGASTASGRQTEQCRLYMWWARLSTPPWLVRRSLKTCGLGLLLNLDGNGMSSAT